MEYSIEPPKKFSFNFKELWSYRELFYFFTWRDIKVKYKQTYLGFTWAILQPVLLMLIFTLIFKPLVFNNTSSIPYPVFVYMGLMLWNIFSSGVQSAGNSMVQNANIIKKIYFPRLIIPVSSVLISLFDFLMTIIPLIGLLWYYHVSVDIVATLWKLPVSIFLMFTTTLGVGALLSALTVKFRDFRYVIPFMIQALMFATPIVYPNDVITNPLVKTFLYINPVSTSIELFRSITADTYFIEWNQLLLNVCISVSLLLIGIFYFRKTERFFADIS